MLSIMPEIRITLDPINLFLSLLAGVLLWLYLAEYKRRQHMADKILEMSLGETEGKSRSIIKKAIIQAQTILGLAEKESAQLVSESKLATGELENQLQQQFDKASMRLEEALVERSQITQNQFTEYLKSLTAKSQEFNKTVESATKQTTDEIIKQMGENMNNFFIQLQDKSTAPIESELQATRQLIDDYKRQQLGLIDENIISMLERTLSLVLTKKLTLKDQLDLVYESLEKAKAEKFIL